MLGPSGGPGLACPAGAPSRKAWLAGVTRSSGGIQKGRIRIFALLYIMRMSAFPNSGHSVSLKSTKSNVRFRPEADI